MEEDLMTPDDPTESHDNDMEAEEEKESTKNHTDQMAGQSSVLPCNDQCDPDKTSVEESGSYKTAKKSSKKNPCKIQQGAVFSGKILSFGCSECKGDATYSPNDLLKHFQGAHKGTLPTYPCDLCGFATNEFPALQRHRIGHRNTLVTCKICNDDVQYSLLLLTGHYIMSHSQNGHFHCEKCEFSTVDAGTFVQHIHHHNESRLKCVKCEHMSSNRGEHQRHLQLYSGTFPFTCQVCGYGAAWREYHTKHVVTVHGEETDQKNLWRATEDSNNILANSSSGFQLLLKKSPAACGQSNESQWMSKVNSRTGVGFLDRNGQLLKPEKTLEESQRFVRNDSKKWFKGALKNDKQFDSQAVSSIPTSQDSHHSYGADALNPNNSNGLTVLMVKNKSSIPPNCTTKVMGFKMVDGKKHLVLKVIPTAKPEFSAGNYILSTEQEVGCPMIDATSDGSKCSDSGENGENTSSPHMAVLSPSGTDRDAAISIQVKPEEEDISIEEMLPILEKLAQKEKHTVEQRVDEQHKFKGDRIPSWAVSPMTKESDHSTIESGKLSNNTADKMSAYSSPNVTAVGLLPSKMLTDNTMPSESAYETMLPKPVSEETINILGVGDMSTADKISDPINENSSRPNGETLPNKTPPEPMTGDIPPSAEKTHSVIKEMDPFDSAAVKIHSSVAAKTKTGTLSPDLTAQLESHPAEFVNSRETDINAENLNPPNQELFSFHNSSKETSRISSDSTQPCKNLSELSTEDESVWMKESPEWSLTLAASPPPPVEGSGNGEVETETAIERVSDSDIEVDECIATVEDLATPVETEKANHGHSGSTHQVQSTIKMQEECVPLSERTTGSISSLTILDRILEEHSDAIISHQLEKDRMDCSAASHNSVKQPKTMLKILKTAQGKQQMFLQTAENRYAVPMQLQGNPGFKLITKSAPQINVSYVKPGIERPNNTTGLALTLNGGSFSILGQTVGASGKGAMILSTVQPGASTIASHYLVNSTALKGPLLLSGTAHSSPVENTLKSPQTCSLVRRPVPVGQVLPNADRKLARLSSQSPLMSRPVLAISANSVNRSTALHTGRQAFLVRYISPAKSGMLLNSPDGKYVNQKGQANESRGNKVVYKIVRTANGSAFLSGGAHSSANKPIYLPRNSTQMSYFLMSSNKVSTGVKKLIPIQNGSHKPVTASLLSNRLSPQSNVQGRVRQQVGIDGLNKSPLDPMPSRQLSQRKRRRKALCDELPEQLLKARRLLSKAVTEKGAPKDTERTLRLYPFSSLQEIKCPRRNQPVVVLNHPDADILEVTRIMRSVNRYKGAVSKVALSQNTGQALSELGPSGLLGKSSKAKCPSSQSSGSRLRPSKSRVRERFLLKLKFRKSSRKKYEVVKSLSRGTERSSMFACWFCGRLFNNQEEWIGHGQRHLMEATRDWNKLF